MVSALETLSSSRYVSPYSWAILCAGFPEDDRVLDLLEKAYRERCAWMAFLQVEPKFERFRRRRRFKALLNCMAMF